MIGANFVQIVYSHAAASVQQPLYPRYNPRFIVVGQTLSR